ncbi:MAG: pirin family protein [Microlunatus sp.]|nr:pirin family protein [Microlunatus sp.]
MSEPTIEIRRADGRFETRTDWLRSRSSFSFGPHYDPADVGFGPLIVHNHELVAAGTGFDTHPHADAEIVTWVLSGALVHEDSRGHSGIVHPGLAQRMSAGSGILHSERNDAYRGTDGWRVEPERVVEPADYVQMWLRPDTSGLDPSYQQRELDLRDLAAGWLPVASGSDPEAAIAIDSAGSTFWTTVLAPGEGRTLPAAGALVHLYVARGAVEVEEVGGLAAGDAVRFTGAEPLRITASADAELLVWEMGR